MHLIVKINKGCRVCEGEEQDSERDSCWHLVSPLTGGDQATFCRNEVFGFGVVMQGESEVKEVKKGGITCPECLAAIKEIKAIKL